MNANVKQKFQSLEYQREYLFSLCLGIPTEKTNVQFATKTWSLAQVYYHLYLVERRVFDDISKRLKSYQTAEPSGFKEAYRLQLMKLFLRLPLKFKAPKVVEDDIPESVDLEKLKEDWSNLRQAIELLLNVNSDEQLKLKLFRHPRIGLINIVQTLEFIKAHHKHHLPQVKNLLSKINR